jgi:L-alanine-DL-glutamate epimerase-like enolase superfamily enzyme
MAAAQEVRAGAIADVPVDGVRAAAYTIPTDAPESDGTLEWDETTLVVAEVSVGDETGLGYTYADASLVPLISGKLAQAVEGRDAMDVAGAWAAMVAAIRNLGRPGLCSCAIAAVDTALWDLKARVCELPLATLLGRVREEVPVYGSGGFTSYSEERLGDQLAGWVEGGIPMVKMKVGREPDRDPQRVHFAREAIGPGAELFVDANGAYTVPQALGLAGAFTDQGVTWFEEPVSSDDLAGLRAIRGRAPAGMAIAAGEYGYDLPYFERMLGAGAVDVLQADVTRCAGITELLRVGALCAARGVPLSAHTAPALHLHPCLALDRLVHLEYFHDHVRIEKMVFDGVAEPADGCLRPDLHRPGHGLELRRADAERYRVA